MDIDIVTVRQEVQRVLNTVLEIRKCPICNQEVTMVSVSFESEFETKWRCLGCLGLFKVELREC